MNEKKQIKPGAGLIALSLAVCLVLGTLLAACDGGSETGTTGVTTLPDTSAVETTAPQYTLPIVETREPIVLEEDLEIVSMGSYVGAYMEDGTDEIVSDVMMILVSNMTERDLQYAQITVSFADSDRCFTVTNLPSGKSAVLLEQERQAMPDGEVTSTSISSVAYFDQPMSLNADAISITGTDGIMNVQNVSGGDISGDIYVYYKYYASGYYYGGITFRVKVEGGLSKDEVRQFAADHFDPQDCVVVMVTTG